MRVVGLAFVLAAVIGCGEGGTKEPLPGDIAQDTARADKTAEIFFANEVEETAPADLPPEFSPMDLTPELPPLQCDPGEGCFMDKCNTNSDCQAGWCVEHLGDGVCTQSCQDECPAGWTCQQVAGTEPDVVFICVSEYASLCKPCAGGGDCGGIGTQDVCVDYGEEGSFCGGSCEDTELGQKDCPWGFLCQDATTVEGVVTKQCIAEAGVCPCTHRSIDLGLSTPCRRASDEGVCAGTRLCEEQGLSECNALVPVPEECNGQDDNCNGITDEATCSDDIECTKDTCDPEQGCLHDPLDTGECMDGNPCTVADNCQQGECIGSPVICDDDNVCTYDSCDELGGCVFTDNQEDCDDDDPCTVGDHCKDSACIGTDIDCGCMTDTDCIPLDDGDACNGSLFCDQTSLPYSCEVDPESIVECPEPEGPDALCLQATCAPDTGECSLTPDHEGFACNDEDACTIGDQCQAGVCTGGAPLNCNDGNDCTDDSCDAESGCVHTPNSAQCQDGDLCTVGDVCADSQCQPGKPLACDDNNPCTDDFCNPDEGCEFQPNDAQCDDFNPCTEGDHCHNGVCQPEEMLDCDDGNICTDDSCDPAKGCTHQLNNAACDDSNACTTQDKCTNGWCQGIISNCNDFNACTDDSCVPETGCLHEANDDLCNDGSLCTTGDHCQNGECVGAGQPDCHDDNLCTDDECDPALGCVHKLNNEPCDDEDPCTVDEQCGLGLCQGGQPLACDDAVACTLDTCSQGCQHQPDNALCDDNEPCTDDLCDPGQGCVHSLGQGPCEDGDPCTQGDTCQLGLCVPGPAENCDDGNDCTEDSCDAQAGCTYQVIEGPCPGGQCQLGECQPDCVPACQGKECGPDGCNGSCGDCQDGFNCINGKCFEPGGIECDDGNDILWDGCTQGEITEFRVNTFTPGEQTYPDVIGLDNGNYVVTWASYDQDGAYMGVYGQRFASDGSALGGEFQANTYTDSYQTYPEIAAIGQGRFMIVWQSANQDGSSYGIYAQRYAANGTKLGTEFRVNDQTNQSQDEVAVSGQPDGSAFAAWRTYPDQNSYGVFGRRVDGNGAPVGTDMVLNTYKVHTQDYPEMTSHPAGYVAVWQSDNQDTSSWGVYGQRFGLDANKVGSEIKLHTYTPSDQRYPGVAADATGAFVAVWESQSEDGSSRGIYCQRFKADGSKIKNPFRVNTYIVSSQERPTVASWPDGRFVVAWVSEGQDLDGAGIYAQLYNTDGTPMGNEFRVNSYTAYNQRYPSVSTLHQAGFVVVWNSQAQDDSVSGVFAQRYDAGGNKLYH